MTLPIHFYNIYANPFLFSYLNELLYRGEWNVAKREFKIFVAIADIHIGLKHISAKSMKEQLKKNFIEPIKTMKYLDGIFILGDLLHTIISMNSDYAEVMQWFIDKVYKEARRRKDCVVLVLKGTISHDNDQLNNIKHYQLNDDGVDFRIYERPEAIRIWKDYKVLVLPDVRVKNTKEIDKLLEDRYDLILGHGTIDAMQFFVQESEDSPMKTIVYDSDKLMEHSNGPVLFGHIHQHQSIRNQFHYAGSFTLLERGVTDPGFLVGGIYDNDRTKYRIERYSNPDAPKYFEWIITKNMLEEYDALELMGAIDELLEEVGSNDLITLRITRGDDLSGADKVMMIESRYRPDKRFSITKKIKTKKEEEHEKLVAEKKEKFGYVADAKTPLHTIMFRYYESEIKPTITDPTSPLLGLTEKDIENALKP